MPGRNGVVAKALAIPRALRGEPDSRATLLAARNEVRLSLAKTDIERSMVQQAPGWEERPSEQVFFEQLERRAVDEEDKEILARAGRCRILLSDRSPQPEPDPELEALILQRSTRKAAAEAVAELRLNELVAVRVAKAKAKKPGAREVLLAKEREAAVARQDAVAAVDREASMLASLLNQRANRRRALALAESTVRA